MVQQCVVHLIRNSFRYAGRQHRYGIVKALKPVCTAPSEQAAKERFADVGAGVLLKSGQLVLGPAWTGSLDDAGRGSCCREGCRQHKRCPERW